mmetsp:Transcript_7512/g.12060  ORF Transcript_7512/g.12060 Transcript_7512/m.12060 type:complete len:241 (+) Transcript_7512:120-842(+)
MAWTWSATCCCATNGGSETVVSVGESPDFEEIGQDTNRHHIQSDDSLAENMKHSTEARFFKRELEDLPAPPSSSRKGSPRTAEEKEREKARLQVIVTEFKQTAVRGISVALVDPDTLVISKNVFSMDKLLYKVCLEPSAEAASRERDGASLARTYAMEDFESIYKEPMLAEKAPKLAPMAKRCLGVDFVHKPSEAPKSLYFYFASESERDKFYTCLKILHMSATILRRDLRNGSASDAGK